MQPAPSRQLHHDAQTAVSWGSENYQANLKCLIVSWDRSGQDPGLIPDLIPLTKENLKEGDTGFSTKLNFQI